jgi:23S rRNA pseudouridine1911/1915/1917 synthase
MKKSSRGGDHKERRPDSGRRSPDQRPDQRSSDQRSSAKPGPRQQRHGGGGRGNRSSRELRVIYEDEAVIAVDKPAGLTAVPVEGTNMPSAWEVVAEELKKIGERTYVVHRIDRFTSGVMLFAKTVRDRDVLVKQFLAHTPVREYLAVVRGRMDSSQEPGREETLVHYFRRDGMFQKLTHAGDYQGARAELRYAVERPLRSASLVRVTLVTGLQNQIRVQFAALGHPVIGDRKYSPDEASERRIDRVALHAVRLGFTHPRSGKHVAVDSKPPADFNSLVQALSLPSRK